MRLIHFKSIEHVLAYADAMDERTNNGEVGHNSKTKKRFSWKDLTTVTARVYIAQSITTWGDRMWEFGVSLFLIKMAKNSELHLTAAYGISCSLAVIMFGALVGRWIDRMPRFKAVVKALIVQNTSVVACTVFVYLTLFQTANIPKDQQWITVLLETGVILTGTSALIASIANNICIEKDWIVIIAKGDKEKLSRINAVCRRIDLTTKICSPFVVGYIMAHVSTLSAALFIMTWNLVSVVAEYVLLRSIYRSVPELAHNKTPTGGSNDQPQVEGNVLTENGTASDQGNTAMMWNKARKLFLDYRDAWTTYYHHPIFLAGLGLACLYMTVLAFDGVTIGYAYGQGVSEDILAGIGAIGAISGIMATLAYPKLRTTIGIERSGLLGFCTEVSCLVFCVASVWASGSPFKPSSILYPTSNGPVAVKDYTSVILLMTGITSSRFGLWLTDLSINQIFQEEVEEAWRGRINGVQSALNMTMDLMKYVLVMVFPKPENFGLLILASFAVICSGWASYTVYCKRRLPNILPLQRFFQHFAVPPPQLRTKRNTNTDPTEHFT